MILYLNYQYLAIRKRQAFHTFLVPFSVYSYRKQLSKNTEKTTARADQTTCISVVIETLLKLKNIFFFEDEPKDMTHLLTITTTRYSSF